MGRDVFLTDGKRGLFRLSGGDGTRSRVACALESPRLPCAGKGRLYVACGRADAVARYEVAREGMREAARFYGLPGLTDMCASSDGRALYLLGGDADRLHAVDALSGGVMYGCDAGVYPRAMRLSPSGEYLAVAGGASGEALVLLTPALQPLLRVPVPGVACAVDFWRGRLIALCAVEDGDIRTGLYIAGRTAGAEEALRLPGLPGALLTLPDGSVMLGTTRGLTRLSLEKRRVLFHANDYALPTRLSACGDEALVTDGVAGAVKRLPWRTPWEARTLCAGGEADGAFAG